ncbi:hypothetical protein P8452_43924 [Trifolium repens]|nr:hypothetical protein P8452_43924 [Trifolium repens]
MSCMVQASLTAISCTIFVVLQYHGNRCEVLHDTKVEGVCQEESPPLNDSWKPYSYFHRARFGPVITGENYTD